MVRFWRNDGPGNLQCPWAVLQPTGCHLSTDQGQVQGQTHPPQGPKTEMKAEAGIISSAKSLWQRSGILPWHSELVLSGWDSLSTEGAENIWVCPHQGPRAPSPHTKSPVPPLPPNPILKGTASFFKEKTKLSLLHRVIQAYIFQRSKMMNPSS